ncbi:ABC transporter ATP-binding protein [Candidatus Dojkabacteria bacterium]|nr:ABC transporter ATP-binding protein [Candidatus Dojkabacteria bacterium]
MQKALSVKHLSKKYGEIIAVNNIEFEINQNEIFALIGSNGAGKSTTLKIVATVLSPTEGTISVFGNDLVKQSSQIRQIIAYLPEEAGAYKNMRGIDYLDFMASLYTSTKEERDKCLEFAEGIADLRERLNDKIKTYSKGMTRKLLLARAVMTKPKLAILDEPTSGLDVINALYIRKVIRDLSKIGMSVLLSSHNMLEIEFLSDKVGIIDKGRIIEIGTPVFLKKKYRAANLEEVFAKITSKTNKT